MSLFETKKLTVGDVWSVANDIVLHNGDSGDFLKRIPDKIFSLIITSPPYNVGKEYEIITRIDNYLANQKK